MVLISDSLADLGNSQNGSGGCCKKQKTNKTLPLQRALEAAALQRGFHLLGVRGAVVAAEKRLPPPVLGDAAAHAGGCRGGAGSGTIHAGDLGGGRACCHRVVALQQLPHHLPLTRKLCVTGRAGVPRLTVADGLSSR